jgi:ubiquinone/menaquinone biosynthesis C-methylase UbiE
MNMNEKITESTKMAVPLGFTVFQIFQFADTDTAHVKLLLEMLQPPTDAKVLDVGCGVGAVPRLMRPDRRDLQFTLLGNNEYQLSLCPDFLTVSADLQKLPLPFDAGSFDVIMCNYAIGYGDLGGLLAEFHRLLTTTGVLFIVDMLGPSKPVLDLLEYRTYSEMVFASALRASGFDPVRLMPQRVSLRRFRQCMRAVHGKEYPEIQMLLETVEPVVWRCMRAA